MLGAILAASTLSIAAPTVVVVPFATLSAQEYAPIAHGAALAVAAQLADNKELNVVTPAELTQVLRRLDLTTEALKSGGQAVELARTLGADWLITGSYQARWPDLQITLRIVDGKDGKVRAEAWELVKIEQALSAIESLCAAAFPQVGWAKVKSNALGTNDIYAWREASLAAELLAIQAWNARPRAYLAANALRKARLHCEEAARLDPKWAFGQGCVAETIALSAITARDAKISELALETAKKAGTDPFAAYAIYLARVQKGEDKEAVAALEAAIARSPGVLALSLLASEHHQIRGAHAEAKKILEKVLTRAPDHPQALARLGKTLVALGEGEKGLAMTKRAIEKSGGDPQIQVELGSRLIDLNRLDEAEATLKKAMEADKRDGRAYLRLGYVYLLKKKPSEAIAVLERSIAESDLEDEWRARAFAHFDLARAHGQVGEVDKAFKELELAIDNGFADRKQVEGEADLAVLARDPRWAGLLEKLDQK